MPEVARPAAPPPPGSAEVVVSDARSALEAGSGNGSLADYEVRLDGSVQMLKLPSMKLGQVPLRFSWDGAAILAVAEFVDDKGEHLHVEQRMLMKSATEMVEETRAGPLCVIRSFRRLSSQRSSGIDNTIAMSSRI